MGRIFNPDNFLWRWGAKVADYVFLSFEIGNKTRNFNWQVVSDSTSKPYFSNDYISKLAGYYQGSNTGLFIPVTNTTTGQNLLRKYKRAKNNEDKDKIYNEIEGLQPQIKELYDNRRYCDGIYKRSIQIQNNIDNFDRDINLSSKRDMIKASAKF